MKILWCILSAVGLMKSAAKNKISLWGCILAVAWWSVATVEARSMPSLALYGEPKYAADFINFEYTNPKAPKGGRVVMPSYGNFDSLNPFIFKGNAATEAAALTLDTLGIVPVDDYSTVYPLLAKKFELPQDHSFVGFELDERAKFSNGKPVTADDVIFSFKAITEQGAPIYKVYYADVDRVEKVNDRKVRFYFKKNSQNKELPLILAQLSVFSADDWKGKDFSKPTLKPFVGSGPYVIDKVQAGKSITFKRNPDYWAKDLPSRRGFFNFDEVVYDYYQDTTVTLQALFAGNIDMREEYIAKNWVTGYDNKKVAQGQVIKEEIEHNKPTNLQMFVFNLRKSKFADRRVRQAIGLAFDFDWANEKLFYSQYKRIESYFNNTGMEAKGLPQGKELKILNKYRAQLPKEVFSQAPKQPSHKGGAAKTRENLKQAVKLLNAAGYDFVDGKMTNLKTEEPLELEIIDNSANGSSFTRVMLPFINNLKKIGIEAKFRTVEVNIYKNRLDNFDFDIAILAFGMSQMPGNEQKEMWGSKSAMVKGSYNIGGVQNKIVDALIEGLIKAQKKDDYQAYVAALDRVMLNEYYVIPNWYSPADRVAYQNKFEHPKTKLKVGFQPFSWWLKEEFRQ